MNKTVIIRLGRTATDRISWLSWSNTNQSRLDGGELDDVHSLALLQPETQTAEVVVLVPADQVILRKTVFSVKNSGQTMKVLPYLLEEAIVGDVEKLHVVILENQQGEYHLMAVDVEKMQEWLSWFALANIRINRLAADVLAIPFNPLGWSALKLANEWIIRQTQWSGVTINEQWIPSILANLDHVPSVMAYSDDKGLPAGWIDAGEGGLVRFAGQLPEIPTLLTGQFKSKAVVSVLGSWAVAAAIGLVGVGLYCAHLWFDGHIQEKRTAVLRQEAEKLYRQAVPDDTSTIKSPRLKLEKKLQSLEKHATEPGFLWLFGAAAPVLENVSGLRARQLEYDISKNVITINIVANDLAPLQSYKVDDHSVVNFELTDIKNTQSPLEAKLVIKKIGNL